VNEASSVSVTNISRAFEWVWISHVPCPGVFASYTLAFCLTAEEKARKTRGHGNRRVPLGTVKTEYTEQRNITKFFRQRIWRKIYIMSQVELKNMYRNIGANNGSGKSWTKNTDIETLWRHMVLKRGLHCLAVRVRAKLWPCRADCSYLQCRRLLTSRRVLASVDIHDTCLAFRGCSYDGVLVVLQAGASRQVRRNSALTLLVLLFLTVIRLFASRSVSWRNCVQSHATARGIPVRRPDNDIPWCW